MASDMGMARTWPTRKACFPCPHIHRRLRMRATRVIALAVATALAVSACSSGGDSGESTSDGTITLSMGTDPGHTLPPDGTESVSSTLLNMVYDGAYDYDTSGQLVPPAAA